MSSRQLNDLKNIKKFNSINNSYDDNLKVYIRVRPPLIREKDSTLPFRSIANVSEDKSTISLIEYIGFEFDEASKQKELIDFPNHFLPHPYTFDYIFGMNSTQEEVYEIAAVPSIESLVEGYNSTIFAYGQTGTGKTYTMEGFTYDYSSPKKGLIPRAIEDIFKYIENNLNSDTTFIIRITYLQIYNESIDDLLKSEKKHLSIRESQKKGLYVEGLSEWAIRSPNDIYALLERGEQCRTKASTKMNDVSSRSHAVFTIILEQMKISNGKKRFKSGKLNMVDLAGSERIKITGATGKQLDESRRINKSLSALGNVINALTDSKTKHIPYRDSKLTRLLQNSLGGNCKTSMIAMISPYDGSYNESISTLNFAKRAKTIRIKASINEEVNQKSLISQYEKELNRLRHELDEKNEIIKSNAFLKKIEMEKIQAEKDKNEALQALEKASLRFLQEREEKRKLEKKIEIMNFQLIPGGKKIKIEDTPEFKTLLQKHQILLQKDFNEKLNDLEKEKELIQISKEQVDSYNILLHKQRETMDNLTSNLKEKEDNINHLNEIIDSYEKIINEQDNIIEIKNQRIKLLENILIKNKIKFPKDTIIKVNNNFTSMTGKINTLKNKGINQDIIIANEEKKEKSNINNINENENKDKSYTEENNIDNNIDKFNLNDSEEIIIKFSNISNNENEKNEEINEEKNKTLKSVKENKTEDKNKSIKSFKDNNIIIVNNNKNNINVNNNTNKANNINSNENDSKNNEIEKEKISSIKNITNDIILEKNNNNENDDEDNFNVIMSGSLLNTNNKKVEYKKSNNNIKKNYKNKINQINVININTQKKPEKISKLRNLSKTLNSNLSKDKKKYMKTKENNISLKKNENLLNFKSSKHLVFENKRYSIESKDQLSFLMKNESKKKKNRTIKTPDIESKNINRMKNKINEDNLVLKNK